MRAKRKWCWTKSAGCREAEPAAAIQQADSAAAEVFRATCEVRTVIEEVIGVFGTRSGTPRNIARCEVAHRRNYRRSGERRGQRHCLESGCQWLEAVSSGGRISVSANVIDGMWCRDRGRRWSRSCPAVREKILQPFFTTKTQGTGLGLAIVARRVNEFAGSWAGKSRARWKRQRVSSFDSVGSEARNRFIRSGAE